jgi:opacity protein-like surface antigen
LQGIMYRSIGIFQHNFFVVLLMSIVSIQSVVGQSENFRSRSTFGLMAGGSYYIGDLNPYGHFRNTKLSGGFLYRYHINSRIELRGNLLYGQVGADDANSKIDIHRNRNLSFQSDIWELTGGIEFNYFNYQIGNPKYFITPYMFIEMGVFRMNPTTELNGEQIELQPLGTEGQGSSLSNKDPYSLTQIVIPFGVGVKINVTRKVAIGIEYGMRKTFTDYLDDVGGNYVNQELLIQENGNLAARLADRSLGEFPAYGPRGNSSTKDWYAMFGLTLTFKLGNPDKCFYH